MTFEIATEIFAGSHGGYVLMSIVGGIVSLLSLVMIIAFLFEPFAHRLWAIPALVFMTLFVVMGYYGFKLDAEYVGSHDAQFKQVLEEKGLTQVDLNSVDKTFIAEDANGKFVNCGMIPLSGDNHYKVVCED